jgi:hypothetical protein
MAVSVEESAMFNETKAFSVIQERMEAAFRRNQAES